MSLKSKLPAFLNGGSVGKLAGTVESRPARKDRFGRQMLVKDFGISLGSFFAKECLLQ